MFPLEELDPHLQRLLPFFDNNTVENTQEHDMVAALTQAHPILLTLQYQLFSNSQNEHAHFVHNLLKSCILASHLVKSLLKHIKEMPVPSDNHHPVHTRITKNSQLLVMPTGKPGPGHLKHIKAELQPSTSGQSRGISHQEE
ncbi:hypothetical protein IW262DRAFT_1303022 [Armillaria fumosa]|nr:hypothetical protein IW262DRAFT_1303022 [Armillaria fumosa]